MFFGEARLCNQVSALRNQYILLFLCVQIIKLDHMELGHSTICWLAATLCINHDNDHCMWMYLLVIWESYVASSVEAVGWLFMSGVKVPTWTQIQVGPLTFKSFPWKPSRHLADGRLSVMHITQVTHTLYFCTEVKRVDTIQSHPPF